MLNNIKLILLDFIKFILNPVYVNYNTDKNIKKIIFTCTVLFIFIFFLKISISIFNNIVFDLPKNEKANLFFDKYSISHLFLFVILLGPIQEELAFRLYLRFNLLNLSVSSSLLTYFFINRVVFSVSNIDFGDTFPIRVIISIFIGLIIMGGVQKKEKKISFFWKKNFKIIFYISCFLFALVHIMNYNNSYKLLYTFPFIILPQFIGALVYGYVRIFFGFKYGLFLHMLGNCFFLIKYFV